MQPGEQCRSSQGGHVRLSSWAHCSPRACECLGTMNDKGSRNSNEKSMATKSPKHNKKVTNQPAAGEGDRAALEKKALGGDAKAQCNLGNQYYATGELDKAKKWLGLAAQQGYATAQWSLGVICWDAGDTKQAVKLSRLAADQGHAHAQFNLGVICLKVGDEEKAFEWFGLAADQGLEEAEYNLGALSRKRGDLKQAIEWYRRAADRGYASAQINLGLMYQDAGDNKRAKASFRAAADQGHAGGQNNVGNTYDEAGDYEQAIEWHRLAADQGSAEGNFNVGLYYAYGIGVERDLEQAVIYYRRAATLGYMGAAINLGVCYFYGRGVTQDYAKAFSLYETAATRGNSLAWSNLAGCYFSGSGTERDYAKAVECWKKAAASLTPSSGWHYGNTNYHLAYCFVFGLGVKRDLMQAMQYYNDAAGAGHVKSKQIVRYFQEKYPAASSAENSSVLDSARRHRNLGRVYHEIGKLGKADRELSKGIEIYRRIAAKRSITAAKAKPLLGLTLHLRGDARMRFGKDKDSAADLKEAILIFERLVKPKTGKRYWQVLADCLQTQRQLFLNQGKNRLAAASLERTKEVSRRAAARAPVTSMMVGINEFVDHEGALGHSSLKDFPIDRIVDLVRSAASLLKPLKGSNVASQSGVLPDERGVAKLQSDKQPRWSTETLGVSSTKIERLRGQLRRKLAKEGQTLEEIGERLGIHDEATLYKLPVVGMQIASSFFGVTRSAINGYVDKYGLGVRCGDRQMFSIDQLTAFKMTPRPTGRPPADSGKESATIKG